MNLKLQLVGYSLTTKSNNDNNEEQKYIRGLPKTKKTKTKYITGWAVVHVLEE